MKKAETQEQEFLEVCSSYDYDLLTGKREMTLKDYERITYLVSSLGYSQYLQFLIGKYMDLAQAVRYLKFAEKCSMLLMKLEIVMTQTSKRNFNAYLEIRYLVQKNLFV